MTTRHSLLHGLHAHPVLAVAASAAAAALALWLAAYIVLPIALAPALLSVFGGE